MTNKRRYAEITLSIGLMKNCEWETDSDLLDPRLGSYAVLPDRRLVLRPDDGSEWKYLDLTGTVIISNDNTDCRYQMTFENGVLMQERPRVID